MKSTNFHSIETYINADIPEKDKLNKLTRVIDIYSNVFSKYDSKLNKPLVKEISDKDQIIVLLKYFKSHLRLPKVLNTTLKILDLTKDLKIDLNTEKELKDFEKKLDSQVRSIQF